MKSHLLYVRMSSLYLRKCMPMSEGTVTCNLIISVRCTDRQKDRSDACQLGACKMASGRRTHAETPRGPARFRLGNRWGYGWEGEGTKAQLLQESAVSSHGNGWAD